MKRTFAKRGLMSVVAGFFLLGFMLLSAVSATAQSSNWVNQDEAKVRLEQEVKAQHLVLAAGQPGQGSYDNALLHATYYKSIYRLISDGMSVSEAVTEAMGSVATGTDPGLPAGQNTMQGGSQGLIADATALLTD